MDGAVQRDFGNVVHDVGFSGSSMGSMDRLPGTQGRVVHGFESSKYQTGYDKETPKPCANLETVNERWICVWHICGVRRLSGRGASEIELKQGMSETRPSKNGSPLEDRRGNPRWSRPSQPNFVTPNY